MSPISYEIDEMSKYFVKNKNKKLIQITLEEASSIIACNLEDGEKIK